MIKKLIIGILVLIVGVYAYNYFTNKEERVDIDKQAATINSFEECKAAGFAIMESYPEQCSDGVTMFTRVLTDEEKQDNSAESGQVTEIPDFYNDLEVISTEEFLVEISRSKKECVGVGPQTCLQVKKEDGN